MPFRLEFLGADVPANKVTLLACGVVDLGYSLYRALQRNTAKDSTGQIRKRFGDTPARVHLHPGIPKDYAGDIEEFAARYRSFIDGNVEDLASIIEIDYGPHDWVLAQRATFYDHLDPAVFRPVWNSRDGNVALAALAARYETVGIPEATIRSDTTLASRVRGLVQRYGTAFHAMGCSTPENLRSIPFTSASTLSWLGSQIRGDTMIWNGTRLVTYPRAQKDQARSRHRATFERAGFDADLIIADDAEEMKAATIWAYRQMEKNVSDHRDDPPDPPLTLVPTSEDETGDQLADQRAKRREAAMAAHPSSTADNTPARMRHEPTPRDPSERANLPTLDLVNTQVLEPSPSGPILKEVMVPALGQGTLRQCDTCFVAAQCPAMKPGAQCAFGLPIEVRTKDQLRGLLQAIIEMQGQRVAFARFAEELQGGYPDPTVSTEMDRLFRLVTQLKSLEDNKEFIKITAERHAASGVLSALFGERATQVAQALPHGGLDADATNTLIGDSLD